MKKSLCGHKKGQTKTLRPPASTCWERIQTGFLHRLSQCFCKTLLTVQNENRNPQPLYWPLISVMMCNVAHKTPHVDHDKNMTFIFQFKRSPECLSPDKSKASTMKTHMHSSPGTRVIAAYSSMWFNKALPCLHYPSTHFICQVVTFSPERVRAYWNTYLVFNIAVWYSHKMMVICWVNLK